MFSVKYFSIVVLQTDSHLQSHVKHHGGDNIEVRESYSESPGETKEDEQSSAEPFREHTVRVRHTQH
uniref:Uncharacterized protein n=1 Tax=Sinocyclocheilus rhinocerous TaxID=307959 RepID=A0A673KGW8_9TELE